MREGEMYQVLFCFVIILQFFLTVVNGSKRGGPQVDKVSVSKPRVGNL